jgi:hypothetical protein
VALICFLSGDWVAAQTPAAQIRIDTNRIIGEVNPHVFGNFAEHLGRCIYGGIFEEGSPLSDSEGYRKDVIEAVKPLGVSILRWPGGNFASGYNWMDGVGPRDSGRPPDHAWGALESNRFGTDEFLNTASASAPSRTCASMRGWARWARRGSGSSTATRRVLRTGQTAREAAARSRGTSRSGAWATRSTDHGNWAWARRICEVRPAGRGGDAPGG